MTELSNKQSSAPHRKCLILMWGPSVLQDHLILSSFINDGITPRGELLEANGGVGRCNFGSGDSSSVVPPGL